MILILQFLDFIRRPGVVGSVPAFKPGGPGLIPCGVRKFNFCPGIGCVFFVCVLSLLSPPLCVCLVFWSKNCCSPYRHLTHGHLGCKSLGCKSKIGGG